VPSQIAHENKHYSALDFFKNRTEININGSLNKRELSSSYQSLNCGKPPAFLEIAKEKAEIRTDKNFSSKASLEWTPNFFIINFRAHDRCRCKSWHCLCVSYMRTK
jgi:hypothetical protein